jgi:prepilin-type N-terminal cleavage/methylation domain-containing protein
MASVEKRRQGFTILELLMAMAIFVIICAAMFGLLDMSQKRYNSETQVTAAYQDARLAVDQITRDFNVGGYPPAGIYSVRPVSQPWQYATGPVAWSPNYPTTDCQIGVSCTSPGDYDLIIETRLAGDTNVSWIWYYLDQTRNTLMRAVVTKTSGDPWSVVQSASEAVPLLANVMNNPSDPAVLSQIKGENPTMYPLGTAQPIFQYTCDTPSGPVPCTSPLAAGYNTPRNIRDVNVTLIVATPQRDMQTHRFKLVELNGRGHRLNPDM